MFERKRPPIETGKTVAFQSNDLLTPHQPFDLSFLPTPAVCEIDMQENNWFC